MFVALMLAAVTSSPTRLEIGAWTGANLPTATRSAMPYRLTVFGRPNATIRLTASGLAQGWLAAFCTPNVCAPTHVDVTLPRSGRAVYQFELIREETNAPKRSGARIASDDGALLEVSPATLP